MTRAPLGSMVCRKNSGVCESEAASSMVFTMRHSDVSCAGFDQHLKILDMETCPKYRT
jgi:hypothetical protein